VWRNPVTAALFTQACVLISSGQPHPEMLRRRMTSSFPEKDHPAANA